MPFRILVHDSGCWKDTQEGPFSLYAIAKTFAATEVGLPWVIVDENSTPLKFGDAAGPYAPRADEDAIEDIVDSGLRQYYVDQAQSEDACELAARWMDGMHLLVSEHPESLSEWDMDFYNQLLPFYPKENS